MSAGQPRTSLTHPLQIKAVRPRPGFGRIGITFCPGKQQNDALTGSWDRDLCIDVEAIRQWGAAMVLTLIEPQELEELQVQALGAEIEARHMEWLHLPIADGSTPGLRFEAEWKTHGAGLRARLRDGFEVLVHCKGGLGRAGTIAARLLVELGMQPDQAIAEVHTIRPGAIETDSQAAHVLRQSSVREPQPSRSTDAILDRAKGALIGLAVGDAVGTTLEFAPRDSRPRLMDMIGGGPFALKAGEWTDDTAMALALGGSLVACGELDPADLMNRFIDWRDHGAYSCTGSCFDIGATVGAALDRWSRTGDPFAGSPDPMSAGNGSLMRLAPVALRYWRDREALARIAADQSRTTHAAPEAVGACVTYAEILADAIAGRPRSEVLQPRPGNYPAGVASIVAGSWRGLPRDHVRSSGYVLDSLEAALWSVGRTADFRAAVLVAANLGGDADTTAAIAGQLAGALHGFTAIPDEWLARLAWRERIEALAANLVGDDF